MIKPKQSRRTFFRQSAGIAAAMAIPTIVPRYVLGQDAPSDKVNIGVIGCGWRGSELMMQAYRNDNIQIAAISDLDMPYLLNAQSILDDQDGINRKWIDGRGSQMVRPEMPEKAVEGYLEYERLLERKDIDAVIIAVPDHWHAKTYIDAMDAGKDVYGEKPLSLTIKQGRAIADKASESGKIFQTGSQQRSGNEFLTACEYVRNKRIGELIEVEVGIGGAPQTEKTPDEPVPPGLNWEKWLGQAPYNPYHPLRCHVQFRWFFDYSGGMVTDWGAHHLDITQWGLGMDTSGPRFVEGEASTKPGFYTTFTDFKFKFTYPNGVIVHFGNGFKGGVNFKGTKGSISCDRGRISSESEDILKEPLTSSDIRLYKSNDHMQNWVDCIKTRKQPITNAETGHRSVTVCHIANICGHVGRKLEWDAVAEQFVNDAEANSYLDREQRSPYAI